MTDIMPDAAPIAVVQSIPLDEITVLDTEHRALKQEFVRLYAMQMLRGRVLPPIVVRRTPNGATKFTLIAGRHRLEAHREAGFPEAQAAISKADRQTAAEIGIEENLFRNDPSALERIDGVAAYRELFEARYGEISRGGDRKSEEFQEKSKGQVGPLIANLLGHEEESEAAGFYARVTDRLGISYRQAKRFSTIAKRLTETLHDALIGSNAENRLSVIEGLSKYPPEDQNKIALLIFNKTDGDVDQALEFFAARPREDRQTIVFKRLTNSWMMASTAKRREFLVTLGVSQEEAIRVAAGGADEDNKEAQS